MSDVHQPFAVYLVGLILVGAVVVGLSRGVRRRRWVEGEALVTDVVFNRHRFDDGAAGSQLYLVRADVLTPDGARHPGQAQDVYDSEAQSWAGQRRRAWYDPRDPSRFTLTPPVRERGITGGDVFVWAIVLLVVAVVVAVVVR